MIWTISGPSCSGKTTLLGALRTYGVMARPLLSVTTRHARPSDLPDEYEYVSQAVFEHEAVHGTFLWHVEAHGNRYGTRKADIDRALRGGLYVPLLVLDAVKTLHTYAAQVGRPECVRSLYLHINDEVELRRRFDMRGDWHEDIERRIAECRSWDIKAKKLGVPMHWIDASQTPAEVLAATLAFLQESPRRKMPLR